jgi:hypothetical protein
MPAQGRPGAASFDAGAARRSGGDRNVPRGTLES